MTQLPREIGSGELTALRADAQSSRLYLTVHDPATVYTARLAAVPASTDQVTSITYDTGSGTHTNILADQTLWVGSTANSYDQGMIRIRNLTGIGATSGTFNIAEESEINWGSAAYLTVKDEFAIWPRHIRMNGTTPLMDYDLTYTDENSLCDSVPIMGQHRVLWLDGATVSGTFDASLSWPLNNAITDYLWTAPGASATSGLTTATPTITYNATGVFRLSCAVTNDDGKTFIGYRYVFVVIPTAPAPLLVDDIHLDSLGGDYDAGGWSAQVTIYDDAATSVIRDRALCIIHTRDTYGSSHSSMGFNSGNEGALLIGWISGESITRAPDDAYGSVSFTIEGPQYWLSRIPAYAVGMKNSTTSPSKWTRFQGLTAKATVWHMLHWRTTITRCCDVFALENSYAAARIEAPGAQSLWEQLKSIEYTTVLAAPCADRYGRLHNQIEQQLLDTTPRAAVPDCMPLTGADIAGDVEIERAIVDNASIVDMSGLSFDGAANAAFFSLSPGRVFRRYGDAPEVVDRLVLYDQATTNALCGWFAGWRNNEWPRIAMQLAANNRFVDIAPYQFYTYTLAAIDTPRGIAKTLRLIPRRVSFEFSNDGGYLLPRVDFEGENVQELAITGDTPEEIPTEPPPPPPPPPPPVIIPPPAGIAGLIHFVIDDASAQHLVYAGDISTTSQPTWTELALPANYGGGVFLGIDTTDMQLYVSSDGSRLILTGRRTDDNNITAWDCTNWSSIWNDPTPAAPTWVERIVNNVSTIGGNTVLFFVGNGVLDAAGIWYTRCTVNPNKSTIQIALDGTLSSTAPTTTNDTDGISPSGYGDLSLTAGTSYIRDQAGGAIYSWSGSKFGNVQEGGCYSNEIGGAVVIAYAREAGATDYIAIRNSAGYFDLIALAPHTGVIFSGNPRGLVVYAALNISTNIWVSTDAGASWAVWVSGQYAKAIPLATDGDSGAAVSSFETVTSGNVPVRLHNADGSTLLDITGNWWLGVFSGATSTIIKCSKGWWK